MLLLLLLLLRLRDDAHVLELEERDHRFAYAAIASSSVCRIASRTCCARDLTPISCESLAVAACAISAITLGLTEQICSSVPGAQLRKETLAVDASAGERLAVDAFSSLRAPTDFFN